MWWSYPRTIQTQNLGTLSLHETRIGRDTYRHYGPTSPVRVNGLDNVEVIVRPLERRRIRIAEAGPEIDRCFREITRRLPDLVTSAESVVEQAIAGFWRIEGEARPSASDLLRTARLETIVIDLNGSHELHLHDAGDLIGSHDLIIELGHDFVPCDANFDG